ncbi:MAG: IPT/TIG domain-containing protein [Bryobacteraceae bacterium]
MRNIITGLFFCVAFADAQVVVTNVYNGANTKANLCPGLAIIITGSNLGAFGEPSVITIGGQQAQIIQNGSSVVFAVIPSTVSTGPTTITVSYNGQTSAPFPITLVAYAPGITEVNSAYFFPLCQCFGAALNSQPPGINAANPAAPGSQAGAFVTGLGSNPSATPTVTVGGQVATDVSAQPDGTYLGDSDVIFTVPNGLAAGGQPVVISIGGVSAAPQTLYVGVATPSISGVENSATGTAESTSHAAAPNSILSVYVTNAGNTTSIPSTYPTTSVEGVQVLVNGTAVPIYALVPSSNQINVQLPSELPASGTATIAVQTGSTTSANFTIALGPADVGVFRIPTSAYPNNGAIQIAGTVWDVMPAAVASSYGLSSCTGLSALSLCGQPAQPGQNIVVYWTGGGPTTPNLPTGQVAPTDGSTLYHTLQTPVVTIGGIPAAVAFSGIVPGTAGEYQLNVTIPPGVAAGDQVPMVVTIGSSSDTVTIAIQ